MSTATSEAQQSFIACANCPEQSFSSKCWLANTQHQQSSSVLLGFMQSFHKIKCLKEMNIKTKTLAVSWFCPAASELNETEKQALREKENQHAQKGLHCSSTYFWPSLQTNTGCKLTEFLKLQIFLYLEELLLGYFKDSKRQERLWRRLQTLCAACMEATQHKADLWF